MLALRPTSLLTPLVTLALGLILGYYAIPKRSQINVSHPTSETLMTQDTHQSLAACGAPAPVVPAVGSTIERAAADERETIESLKTKVASLEKELKPLRAENSVESVYDDAETRAKLVNEMLDITDMKAQIENSFDQTAELMLKDNQDPEKKKAVTAIIGRYFSWDTIGPEISKIYAEVYSAEDLQRINHFYRSDAGRLMLDKQPELMSKTMKTIQAINEKNLPKMMEEIMKILPKPEAPKATTAS